MTMNSQSLGSGRMPSDKSGRLVFRSKNNDNNTYDLESNGSSPQDAGVISNIDDTKNEYSEDDPIELTRSTHSLLFSEPVCSLPFLFAIIIAMMSFICLVLACYNNMQDTVGVTVDVRIAQYFSLAIGLLMEEEIPSSLYMLRQIPKGSLRETTPQIKYGKFVFSAVIRLLMGYFFLMNMFLVVVQAEFVLDIFYDVIALQFIQQLDDICFALAKMDVLGKRMKRATMRKCFSVEYKKLPFARRRKLSVFVKVLYMLNLGVLMAGMGVINVYQDRGDYYCSTISAYMPEDYWVDAIVTNSTGSEEKMDLIFPYFNGVYVKNGTINGRPIYVEQNKALDAVPYEDKVPAQFRYCESERAWVFMHPNIRKSSLFDEECPWLLKSSETTSFNLLEVEGGWQIWTGTVSNGAKVEVFCNECDSAVDCNYHGQCVDKKCQCESSTDLEGYFGHSCQFKKPCLQMRGENNDTWRVGWVDINEMKPFFAYERPAYLYEGGWQNITFPEEDAVIMTYGGSRWFGAYYEGGALSTKDEWMHYINEYHAFWDRVYTDVTRIVSSPSTKSSPIGSDFFQIGERGERYGPLGVLHPLQEPPGSGYFDCIEMNTTAHLIYVSEQLSNQ
ncbi:hypothetical protein ACHAWC_008115 [Mediolabrus comicus]